MKLDIGLCCNRTMPCAFRTKTFSGLGKALYLLVWVLCPVVLWSQSIPDLRQELATAPTDSARISTLLKISGAYRYSQLDSAIAYGERALDMAKRNGDEEAEVKCHYQLGAALHDANRLEEALAFAKKASEGAGNLGNLFLQQVANNLIGTIYRSLRSPEKALNYQMLALDNAREMSDTLGMAYALVGISTIYSDQRDTIGARDFLQQARGLFPPLDDPYLYIDILGNLSILTSNLKEQKKILDEAVRSAHMVGDTASLSYVYNFMGNYWIAVNQPDSANWYFQRGIDMAKKLGDPYSLLDLQIKLGGLYLDKKMLDSAEYYQKLAKSSPVLEDDRRTRLELARLSADIAAARGQYQRAYAISQEANELLQVLQDDEVRDLLSDARIRYETAEKENQIAQQQLTIETQRRRRNLQLILAGLMVVLALGGLLFFRQRRKLALRSLALERERTQQLEELDRMKSRFFANVSHELRTPLTLVLGPLDVLLEDDRLQRYHPALKGIRRNARRLLDRVNELLDISRLESGQLELLLRPVAVKGFLDRVGGAFYSLAETHDQTLSIELAIQPDLWVQLDTDKLEKVLNNLLHNALKFSGSGSQVNLKATWQSDELTVAVIDDGPGLPAAQMDQVFNRFYRGTQTEQIEGSGLGLAIVRELVQVMKGDVSVQQPEKGGTCFTVNLPAPETDAPMIEAKSESGPIAGETIQANAYQLLGGVRPRILIVEDQPELASFIEEQLRDTFETRVAHNGFRALEILQSNPADLIISDIMMPDMDGFRFRENLNQREAFRDIPFIFLTARSLEADRLRAFRLGVDDYLLKPFSVAELKARLENLLARRQDRQQGPSLDPGERPAAERLVRDAEKYVLDNLDDPALRVDSFAKAMGYSPRQLGRLLKKETGLSPVAFILELRLQRAYQLLQERTFFTVSEVRYEVGIESASYFSSKFQARYGIPPSDLLKAEV